jgi:homoserine dehydrogenase
MPLRVALLGLGTVGGAVARGLLEGGEHLARATGGRPIHLVAVGVRDPERPRAVLLPRSVVRSADLAAIAGDPGVDVVVELLGGTEPAGELIATALAGGRSVVTANKALLARRGAELEARARRSGASLRFEASVGGGIPLLAPLAADLAANRWRVLGGIVNGTTNFVLSAMAGTGADYGAALAQAQALGYAESDPSGDVEGRDAADKLAILVRLAFGAWPDVAAIRRAPPAVEGDGAPGITGVTAAQVAAAAALGLGIRLVARATRADDGIAASVMPTVVPAGSPLGRTMGVANLVELDGEPIGRLALGGPGAGSGATSSAVLGDLVAIARDIGSTWAGLPAAGPAEAPPADPLAGVRRWFHVRPDGRAALTAPGDLETVRAALRAEGMRGPLYPLAETGAEA